MAGEMIAQWLRAPTALPKVSLCSFGCPGTSSIDQAVFKLIDLTASASEMPGLKVRTITTWWERGEIF